MSDNYIGPERRSSEQAWSTFAKQLANLHADVGDIKSGMQDFKEGMKELSAAILKLALVEERQTHQSAALERAFKAVEIQGEKIEKIDARVVELEKNEPGQTRTSEWIDRAVWAIVAFTAAAVASKLGVIG